MTATDQPDRPDRPPRPDPTSPESPAEDLPDPADERDAVPDTDSPAQLGVVEEVRARTTEPGDDDTEPTWDEDEYQLSPGEATERVEEDPDHG